MNLPHFALRWFGKSRKRVTNERRSPRARRATLQLESLEQRAVFSVSPLLAACQATPESAAATTSHNDAVHVVFAPDAPAEIVAQYETSAHNDAPFDEFAFGDGDRWNRTVTNGSGLGQGDATTLRWSMALDGSPIPSYNGEGAAPSNLRAFLAGIYGTNPNSSQAQDQPWFPVIQQVFDRWSALSGITFVYEAADDGATIGSAAPGVIGVRGDIRLSGHRIDGNSGTLAYNFYPTVGDMVLDTADSFFTNTSNNSLRLRNTLAHEIGHGLGLSHVTPTNGTKLMEPMITLGFDGPQADDILAINRGYGDRFEKNGGNNTAASAVSLGAGPTFSINTVSIDDDSDVDWFQISVGAGSQMSVTLTPTGSTYNSNGVNFNSLAQSNLALAIYGSNGTTLIASANINGAGVGETLNNIALPGSGVYYVRVTGSANAAQMYQLSGSVTNPSPLPDVQLLLGELDIPDDTGVADFGSTLVGTAVTRTFTIRNAGLQTLQLTSPISVPSGFELTQNVSQTSLAPGQSTTFAVRMASETARTLSGVLSFTTNDPDEETFNITLTGQVVSRLILDNGDAGFTTAGSWFTWANQGYQNDIHYAAAGNGSSTATWTFNVTPGTYKVAASWYATNNRATNSPYSVLDGTTVLGSTRFNQQQSPNDFSDAGVGWENIGTFTITGSTLTVRLSNDANQYVIADAIRIEKIADVTPVPEVAVSLGGNDIVNNTGLIDFGTTQTGTPVTRTFTVANTGTQNLLLSNPINVPAGFTLVQGFGSTTLTPGQSTTFIVRLNADAPIDANGQISFGTNDADENPFRFNVKGSVVVVPPPPVVQLKDNGDAGFATSGSWFTWYNEGYQNDIHYAPAGNGSATATWTFNVDPGTYKVSASWYATSNRATNSPYSVLDGASVLGTTRFNQQQWPNDFSDAGVGWENIGTFTITGNTLTVRLSNDANQYVIADAIRIEKVADAIPAPEVTVSQNGVNIVHNVSQIDFGTTQPGTPVTRTFTVANTGTQNLLLSNPISVPAGFTLVQGFGSTTVAPGQSTTFTVRLNADAPVEANGQISFGTNDADENPFRFNVKGSVVVVPPPPVVQIMDNGDAGFALNGGWAPWYNEGYQGDIHYAAAGNGSATATWTFNVDPGTYKVSAAWHALYNRATNSPYSVLDGTTVLGTTRFNQQQWPDDFGDAGIGWENIGTFTITGNTLVVRLSNDANQYVIADAIRIEKIG